MPLSRGKTLNSSFLIFPSRNASWEMGEKKKEGEGETKEAAPVIAMGTRFINYPSLLLLRAVLGEAEIIVRDKGERIGEKRGRPVSCVLSLSAGKVSSF